VRVPLPVNRATEYVTVPLPLQVAPPVIVIHVAWLTAIQPHPAPAVTDTLPGPPPFLNATLVGVTE